MKDKNANINPKKEWTLLFDYIKTASTKFPKRFGTILAIIGVSVLTPDTMIMRMSNLDVWTLSGWRGVLSGLALLIIWISIFRKSFKAELLSLYSIPGVLVILAFGTNNITFVLGVEETSIMVVLTALATIPLFAAILSIFLLNETQGVLGWVCILVAMFGVSIVVRDGDNAIGTPEHGSVILGAIYGAITALLLAFTFTMSRKFKQLGILPAAAIGSLFSGTVGFYFCDLNHAFDAPIWTVITMGLVVLPISFSCVTVAPRFTSSALVSLVMLLEMVIGPLWVWFGVGERPSTMMVFGGVIVLAALGFHIHRTQFR